MGFTIYVLEVTKESSKIVKLVCGLHHMSLGGDQGKF